MNYNQLTPSENERLAILAEECAEAIQVIGKIQRHGFASFHPDTPDIDNRLLLAQEVGHVHHAILRICVAKDIDEGEYQHARMAKATSIEKWLHHQKGHDGTD